MIARLTTMALFAVATSTAHASPEWPDGAVRASGGDYIAVPAFLAITTGVADVVDGRNRR